MQDEGATSVVLTAFAILLGISNMLRYLALDIDNLRRQSKLMTTPILSSVQGEVHLHTFLVSESFPNHTLGLI